MIKAVLFDLDGTLADTAADLGGALNRLLLEEGLPIQPYSAIRPIASHGARGLLELGFGVTPADPRFAELRQRFLDHYAYCLTAETTLFDGIAPLIEQLAARDLAWGIVTNKPARFTDPLVAQLSWPVPPAVIVSGDTVGVAKPDPKPMRFAAEQLGLPANLCWYVGDAERDIEAGRAVEMKTVLAGWGYIADADRPHEWGADFSIRHPLELLPHLPV
ncbi:HAD family hydrolase [Chitinolyticbacter meiyuanensis]|uniref:HAD family hydrolase n=1 Tax=Chitinolyticbacter meiyuanensis TaxID=682798 RepID=UPI0011E5E368|nr:HAD-IA family hydrolase [Chitinolyticbacter meiyuanensis]